MYDCNASTDADTDCGAGAASGASVATLIAADTRGFTAIADQLPFGLAMFGPDLRMTMCNRAYRNLYRLRAQDAQPGASGEEIVAARRRAGTAPRREQAGDFIRDHRQIPVAGEMLVSQIELLDGRICSVVRQALPHGGWVSLHHDVTTRCESDRRVDFFATSM